MTPTIFSIASLIKHVISTEATDSFTVRCAVERPLYFAAAEARSPLPNPKLVILSEGAAESKDLRLPDAVSSQRSESQSPALSQVQA